MKILTQNIKIAALLGMLLLSYIPGWAQNKKMTLVAANDCGVLGKQPFLVKGENYTMPKDVGGSEKAQTCNYGPQVIYAFDGMDIQADYRLEVTYLADEERQEHVVVDGNELQNIKLEPKKEQHYLIDLPKKTYAYGQLVLVFELSGKGANAIVSDLNLYSSNPRKPVPFEGQKKLALKNIRTYQVDTNVNAEKVLPVYAPVPTFTEGATHPVLSLNGTWKFNPSPEKDFYKSDQEQGWSQIQVPGEWYMQGFHVDSLAYAGYKKAFTLPDDWKDCRVRVRFDGVHSEYYVYVNGYSAGYHLGGMTPYEVDITPYLKAGTNELALAVRSESLADMLGSLTQYAAHQLGGILRKVTLMAFPHNYISDMRIKTTLENGEKDGLLDVQLAVANHSSQRQKGLELQMSVSGFRDKSVVRLPNLPIGKVWKGSVKQYCTAPLLWNCEQPNRYTLRIDLLQNGKVLETVEKKFGFRQVEVKGNELYVNGKPVKLHGVCRHEMHPLTGRSVSREWELKDILTYKAGNCNFIRTSHYPPCEEMLDICDSLGMFVECESPVCWVGHGANENWQTLNYQDSIYFPYILQANMENIQFNRNHPSILFWSIANESYWCKTFAQVQEYVNKADPTRPHTFHDQAYGGFNNQGSTAPIANIHYPGPGGYKVAAQGDRPMTYGEYCHLNCYNRTELETDPGIRNDWAAFALAPTWENMYQTKGVLGGSIWSGIDDIFQLPDGRAVGYGAWGPIDGWRRPKPEYWDMKKVYSPVKVLTDSLVPSHTLVLDLENRYIYQDLSALDIYYRYGNESGKKRLALAPHQRGQLTIPIQDPQQAHELYLSFTDPNGIVVDEYRIPVGRQVQHAIPALAEEKTKLQKKADRFLVKGKDFLCEVSRASGQILSLQKNGKNLLVGGPTLMVLPLTGGGCYPNHNANTPIYNDLCSQWKANTVNAEKVRKDVVITVSGTYQEMEGEYKLTINANGTLWVDYHFKAKKDVNPRQWGMVFEAPASFDQTFWERKGLWGVYPDDHIGRTSGVAKLFYSDVPATVQPRQQPTWSWSHDANALGSNDFRSTRRNIWYAGLKDHASHEILAVSDGSQHWRAWKNGDRIQFLVADFVSPGDEMFLEGYYAKYRKPLKKGDEVKGRVTLNVK